MAVSPVGTKIVEPTIISDNAVSTICLRAFLTESDGTASWSAIATLARPSQQNCLQALPLQPLLHLSEVSVYS